MIEHANLHHHQLQDGQLEPSSPTSYGEGAGTTQQNGWTQNFSLNINRFNPNCDRGVLNPRLKNNDPGIIPGFNSSMVQHLSPHNWHTDDIGGNFTSQLSSHEDLLNLARIKQELSETNFPKFTDMLSTSSPLSIGDSHDPCYMKGNYELARPMLSTSSPSSTGDSHDPCYMKDNQQRDISDLTDKLLLKTITSPGFPYHGFIHGGGDVAVFSSATRDCSSSEMGGFPGRSGRFSQIFPSINVSNLNQTHSALLGPPRSFDMNSEALDLLNTTRFGGSFGQDSLSPYSGLHSSLGLDQMQSSLRSSSSPSQILSPFSNEITLEPKRSRSSCSLLESNKATEAATKKTRVEPRASCPPLKVRKEKLGDRVAALQQLVAPFGKTDTASVLMEAIGYINFLQNQVETLSVPYMKSSRNKSNRSTHMGSANVGTDDENEEMKRDLRSRGLCLVPLSCMSYVSNIDGGNVDGGV